MGRIRNGVYGAMSGKAGGLVGGKWKQTPYLRSYTIPKYSDTTDQKIQRNSFKTTANFARLLLATFVWSFWNRMTSTMSGFNLMIQQNIASVISPDFFITTSFKTSKGNLEPASGLAADYDPTDGSIAITWDNNSGVNNALGSDLVAVVIADKLGNVYLSNIITDPANDRKSGALSATAVSGKTPADMLVFLSFYRGTGSEQVVSNSVGVACT